MSALKSAIAVQPVGPVAGVAWLTKAPNGLELFVLGKLTLRLLAEGETALVPRPELPGHSGGLPAPEELDEATVRQVIVRGARSTAGRAVIRRGPSTLAEVAFAAGSEPVVATQATSMQTTIAGRRGDEWLVIEGVDGPESRRWCKLPKLGILATWSDIERLLLTSRVCLVDVRAWTVSFVLRASRKLPASMAPAAVGLTILDLATNQSVTSVPVSAVPVSAVAVSAATPPASSPQLGDAPSARVATIDDDESTTRTSVREPPNAPDRAPLPAARTPRPSSGGLRIGRASSPAIPAVSSDLATTVRRDPVHDEPTRAFAIEPAPSSVTRAFSALSDEGALLRDELLSRVSAGQSLHGLALRGAQLSGLVLRGAKLGGLDLTEADLRSADLTSADLTAARLDEAQLDGARLDGAELMMATLRGATLRSATVSRANFAGADLTGADLTGAAPAVAFAGATMTGARR